MRRRILWRCWNWRWWYVGRSDGGDGWCKTGCGSGCAGIGELDEVRVVASVDELVVDDVEKIVIQRRLA